jgi:hypothetical protein
LAIYPRCASRHNSPHSNATQRNDRIKYEMHNGA